MGMGIKCLQAKLDNWGIQFFGAEELCRFRRWGEVVAPPLKLQDNIRDTVTLADEIRKRFGGPVRCSSGYRNYVYNKEVGGSPSSEHMAFRAMDIQPLEWSQQAMERLREIAVEVVGGSDLDARIIHYDKFIHIDTNAASWKTRNAEQLDSRS